MVTMSWAMWVWSLWAGSGRGCCPWAGLSTKVEGFRFGERLPIGGQAGTESYSNTQPLLLRVSTMYNTQLHFGGLTDVDIGGGTLC